jgi:hypothetical protein
MKNGSYKLIRITILIFLVLTTIFNLPYTKVTPKVYAWGPLTHLVLTEKALNQTPMNTLKAIIVNNYEWFKTGLMYPDVTVIYYYTEFKSYRATHDWSVFYKTLWSDAEARASEQAKAFALGVGTHLLQDSIIHNTYIPLKIKQTLVPNNIIHPTVEAIFEAKLIADYPLIQARAEESFVLWDNPFTDIGMEGLTPVEWANQILGKVDDPSTLEDESFTDEASLFNQILYEGGFKSSFMGYSFGRQAGWLWTVFKGFSQILKYALPMEDAQDYMDETVLKTVEWYTSEQFLEPGSFSAGDPTGIVELQTADGFVTVWTYVIIILLTLIIIYYYRRKGRI